MFGTPVNENQRAVFYIDSEVKFILNFTKENTESTGRTFIESTQEATLPH